MNPARRHFLRSTAALALQPGACPLAQPLALSLAGLGALAGHHAHAAGDYRALVCLFMQGGNDSHNWVVPTTASEYAAYAAARGSLACAASTLLPIGNGGQAAGRSFSMPQDLQPLRQWYLGGHAAIMANIGPLQHPLTLAEYHTNVGRPAKLFSHNDQQSTWQSLWPEGASSGWGGRLGDALASSNAQPVFTSISAAGNVVFLSGRSTVQFRVGTEGPVSVQALNNAWTAGSGSIKTVLRNRLAGTLPSGSLEDEYARVVQRAVAANASLSDALAGVPDLTLPTTALPHRGGRTTLDQLGLAQQLRIVARLIRAAPRLGLRRQVFMVQMGGFDTHANQLRDQPGLMAQVAASVDWFLHTLNSTGLLPKVTLFTASEFGRTLTGNGDGCDHGWGSHHFIAGGSTLGGRIHGRFPTVALRTDTDVGSGRLLPTTSVAQLAASLSGWMGASPADIADILPTAARFETLPVTA